MKKFNPENSALMKDLDELFKDFQRATKNKKIMGRSIEPIVAPVERVIIFVGKMVNELENTKERISALEEKQ